MFLNDFTSNNGFRVSKKDLAEIMSNAEIRAFTVCVIHARSPFLVPLKGFILVATWRYCTTYIFR